MKSFIVALMLIGALPVDARA